MKEIIRVDEALGTPDGNVRRALTALGLKGVEKVTDKMRDGSAFLTKISSDALQGAKKRLQ